MVTLDDFFRCSSQPNMYLYVVSLIQERLLHGRVQPFFPTIVCHCYILTTT